MNIASLLPAGFTAQLAAAIRVPSGRAAEPLDTIDAERAAMTALKTQAWDLARASAAERAATLGLDPQAPDALPSMTDYYIATRSPQMLEAVAASNPPVQWTAASVSNFDGMRLEGISVRKEDFSTRGLTAADRESLKMTEEEISQFYADVSANVTFDDTQFYNVHFHPADTFDAFVKGKAASCVNVTFDGQSEGEDIVLKGGKFENIRFTDIRGGGITVADGTQVDGMDIRGAHANLTIGRALVSNLDATDAHIVRLDAAPGAQISHANFDGATISMAIKMAGVTLNDVHFNDANLRDVDLRHATLNGVSFNETQLSGLNLSDAQLINLTVDGQPVNDVHQLAALGVTVNEHTTVETRIERGAAMEAPAIEQAKVRDPQYGRGADAERDLALAFEKQGTLSEVIAQLQQALPSQNVPSISGGADVSLNDIALTRDVAQMERNPATVALEQARAAEASMRMPG